MEVGFFGLEILEDKERPENNILAVEEVFIALFIAKLRLLIPLNMKYDAGAEMLFGSVDENVRRDGLTRKVGGFVELDLDFSGVLVAHDL